METLSEGILKEYCNYSIPPQPDHTKLTLIKILDLVKNHQNQLKFAMNIAFASCDGLSSLKVLLDSVHIQSFCINLLDQNQFNNFLNKFLRNNHFKPQILTLISPQKISFYANSLEQNKFNHFINSFGHTSSKEVMELLSKQKLILWSQTAQQYTIFDVPKLGVLHFLMRKSLLGKKDITRLLRMFLANSNRYLSIDNSCRNLYMKILNLLFEYVASILDQYPYESNEIENVVNV
jgi:hypothetical protein